MKHLKICLIKLLTNHKNLQISSTNSPQGGELRAALLYSRGRLDKGHVLARNTFH